MKMHVSWTNITLSVHAETLHKRVKNDRSIRIARMMHMAIIKLQIDYLNFSFSRSGIPRFSRALMFPPKTNLTKRLPTMLKLRINIQKKDGAITKKWKRMIRKDTQISKKKKDCAFFTLQQTGAILSKFSVLLLDKFQLSYCILRSHTF